MRIFFKSPEKKGSTAMKFCNVLFIFSIFVLLNPTLSYATMRCQDIFEGSSGFQGGEIILPEILAAGDKSPKELRVRWLEDQLFALKWDHQKDILHTAYKKDTLKILEPVKKHLESLNLGLKYEIVLEDFFFYRLHIKPGSDSEHSRTLAKMLALHGLKSVVFRPNSDSANSRGKLDPRENRIEIGTKTLFEMERIVVFLHEYGHMASWNRARNGGSTLGITSFTLEPNGGMTVRAELEGKPYQYSYIADELPRHRTTLIAIVNELRVVRDSKRRSLLSDLKRYHATVINLNQWTKERLNLFKDKLLLNRSTEPKSQAEVQYQVYPGPFEKQNLYGIRWTTKSANGDKHTLVLYLRFDGDPKALSREQIIDHSLRQIEENLREQKSNDDFLQEFSERYRRWL